MIEIEKIDLKCIDGYVSLLKETDGTLLIKRYSKRGNITNIIKHYEYIDENGRHEIKTLSLNIALEIMNKIQSGEDYSSSYIFSDIKERDKYIFEKSGMEDKYTSTGIKFWRHISQMNSYKNNDNNTIISTHISPEGACNLKCPYCSVTYRDTHSRISLEVIKDYVLKLKTRGLKAVILTGGGEPTLYKKFNELVHWLKYDQNLSIALITNGTNSNKVDNDSWKAFSWIRVSINMFKDWENKIYIPYKFVNENCIIGASFVLTVEHQLMEDIYKDKLKMLTKVSDIANKIDAKYVRIIPNCLLKQDKLILMHRNIDTILKQLNDKRFFHQHKLHGSPSCNICHQAYFRPYLSEEPFYKNGKPGAVYPCDSVVLNNSNQRFIQKYQICAAQDILDFIDKKIQMKFNPKKDCSGCVFTSNVNMLNKWIKTGENHFGEFKHPLKHEEFV